ncbi:MAG: 4a-hydroxytetrahydrobiopterin dehydratase [Holophagaceae bacterium]|jgi:4a-hydroxytetrahydrobiopterin dehydratase
MNNWDTHDNHLVRKVRTSDFISGLNLVTAIAREAEDLQHHPDIKLGWGYLEIVLTTHDKKSLTPKDYELAERIDKLIEMFKF